ncbi:type II CAAX endopeptidase family protein [uncultured Flavobacterium sp.]|uniref:CPBP family intramembrane glutamic endopeptidase n=1 Tax=uncultured Flavobacterium sp. TaxID=165435 RepID=UPI0030ECB318
MNSSVKNTNLDKNKNNTMFIAQGDKKENEFWKYLLGSLLVFIASIIGQIPILIAMLYEVFVNNKAIPSTEKDLYSMFDSNLFLFLMLVSFLFALFGLYFVVKKFHNQSFKDIITSRKKIDWKRFFVAFSVWAIISISLILISYFSGNAEIELQFNLVPFLILSIIAILLIPIQTSTEELIFRGYLMQGFYNLSRNKWFPLVMTSVIFGGMHWFNPEVAEMGPIIMVYYIGTGLFLGILTLMDEGTELALGFHAANNLVSALLITSDYSVLRTNAIFKDLSKPEVGYEIFMPIIFYIALLFLFTKLYKWTNWKDKLIGNTSAQSQEPTN